MSFFCKLIRFCFNRNFYPATSKERQESTADDAAEQSDSSLVDNKLEESPPKDTFQDLQEAFRELDNRVSSTKSSSDENEPNPSLGELMHATES